MAVAASWSSDRIGWRNSWTRTTRCLWSSEHTNVWWHLQLQAFVSIYMYILLYIIILLLFLLLVVVVVLYFDIFKHVLRMASSALPMAVWSLFSVPRTTAAIIRTLAPCSSFAVISPSCPSSFTPWSGWPPCGIQWSCSRDLRHHHAQYHERESSMMRSLGILKPSRACRSILYNILSYIYIYYIMFILLIATIERDCKGLKGNSR